MIRSVAALSGLLFVSAALADERRSLHELMSGWGTDLDNAEISADTLKPGLHVLRGAGGAVLVSIGEQGVLMVDDQFPQTVPKLQDRIAELGGGDIDFVVNTHWHFDHADGNPLLGASGSRIIAHSNSRRQMQVSTKVSYVGFHYVQPPYPPEGLPVITFDDSMTLHFNGQQVDLQYFGPAHTTGDAAVFFRGDNVVHVGDLYSGGYPYIDAANGGSLSGLIAVCRAIAGQIDANTTIVSGHAPVASRDDFLDYIAMLETSYENLRKLVAEGQSLDQVLAANPTAEFDAKRGNPTLFITMAYEALARPD